MQMVERLEDNRLDRDRGVMVAEEGICEAGK